MGAFYRNSQTLTMLIDVSEDGDRSTAMNIADYSMVAIQFPSTITTATISYETTSEEDTNEDPTNWGAAMDYTGTAIGTVTATASTVVPLDPRVAQCRYFRIVATDGDEGADRQFTVFMKG